MAGRNGPIEGRGRQGDADEPEPAASLAREAVRLPLVVHSALPPPRRHSGRGDRSPASPLNADRLAVFLTPANISRPRGRIVRIAELCAARPLGAGGPPRQPPHNSR